MEKKPNLLFIMTDQQRYDTLRVYGNDNIHVPNLNRLAESSVVFDRAYVTQPVCTPSRGSIMTGLYPHNHGSIENNFPLNKDIPTIPEIVKQNGDDYISAYIGKWHLGDEIIRQHGFDRWISTEDNYFPYYSRPDYRALRSDYYFFLKDSGFLPDYETDDFSYFTRDFCTRLPEQFSKPAFMAREAERFIRENKDRPFILYLSFLEPHPPYYSAFDELYDPDEIDLPPLFHEEIPDNVPLKYKFNRIYHREIGRHYPMKDEKTWRKLIARYRGAISLVDKYVGKVLRALRQNGLEDRTIVVFTSDHGDMMGDFRMLQKYVMYESAVRVPLLMKIPGLSNRQIRIKEPVSLVDLVPTLLDLMNQPVPARMDGKSLYPAVLGKQTLEHNDVFIEWNGDEGEDQWFKNHRNGELKERIDRVYGAGVRTVVTPEGWKLSLHQFGEHELYNLNEDPRELNNLFFSGKHRDQIKRLSQKIYQWQKETNDTLELPQV